MVSGGAVDNPVLAVADHKHCSGETAYPEARLLLTLTLWHSLRLGMASRRRWCYCTRVQTARFRLIMRRGSSRNTLRRTKGRESMSRLNYMAEEDEALSSLREDLLVLERFHSSGQEFTADQKSQIRNLIGRLAQLPSSRLAQSRGLHHQGRAADGAGSSIGFRQRRRLLSDRQQCQLHIHAAVDRVAGSAAEWTSGWPAVL
jgi:hypothetical protein